MQLLFFVCSLVVFQAIAGDVTAQQKTLPRVVVSTDIGGDDPDDYQSMIHFLMYADRFQIEGLISSPPGKGRKKHIEEVISAYQNDLKNLQKQRKGYPSPRNLRKVTKQGAIDPQEGEAPSALSDGAKWIVEKANKKSSDYLYILVWGSITDVAQAVHADPGIKQKIRIYSIGSWNTVQDEKSRDYLFENHPDLWWIENNTTFRGMYMGGFMEEDFSNTSFVEKHIKSAGSMGNLFWEKKRDIKMGDTPSVLYFLKGDINNPEGESWGGAFIRTTNRATYWSDNPDKDLIENDRQGARSVNKFRKEFLMDWAELLQSISGK